MQVAYLSKPNLKSSFFIQKVVASSHVRYLLL